MKPSVSDRLRYNTGSGIKCANASGARLAVARRQGDFEKPVLRPLIIVPSPRGPFAEFSVYVIAIFPVDPPDVSGRSKFLGVCRRRILRPLRKGRGVRADGLSRVTHTVIRESRMPRAREMGTAGKVERAGRKKLRARKAKKRGEETSSLQTPTWPHPSLVFSRATPASPFHRDEFAMITFTLSSFSSISGPPFKFSGTSGTVMQMWQGSAYGFAYTRSRNKCVRKYNDVRR